MRKQTKVFLFVLLILSLSLCIVAKDEVMNKTDLNDQERTSLTISPNPFRIQTTITVNVASQVFGTIKILALNNSELITIHEGKFTEGINQFIWDGKDSDGIRLPAGKYHIEFNAGTRYTSIKKIIMLK